MLNDFRRSDQLMDTPKPTVIALGDFIDKRYRIDRLLGEGGFGAVFQVFDSVTDESYALKVRCLPCQLVVGAGTLLTQGNNSADSLDVFCFRIDLKSRGSKSSIPSEGALMKFMKNRTHFAKLFDTGMHGPFNYMVMQLVGRSLSQLKKLTKEFKFSNSTTYRLSLQCLNAIETLHNVGILHRDFKPSNFAIGRQGVDRRTVFILDFGLARRFMNSDGTIRKPRVKVPYRGTPKYSSTFALSNEEQSRRDDLISWYYQFIEFSWGALPWHKKHGRRALIRLKLDARGRETLAQCVDEPLVEVHNSIFSLGYYDTPSYDDYRKAILTVMEQDDIAVDEPFDWELADHLREKMPEEEVINTDADDKCLESMSSSVR